MGLGGGYGFPTVPSSEQERCLLRATAATERTAERKSHLSLGDLRPERSSPPTDTQETTTKLRKEEAGKRKTPNLPLLLATTEDTLSVWQPEPGLSRLDPLGGTSLP